MSRHFGNVEKYRNCIYKMIMLTIITIMIYAFYTVGIENTTAKAELFTSENYNMFDESSFQYDKYIWNKCLTFVKSEQAVSISGIYEEYDLLDTCELELPSVVSGLPVVQIGRNAFRGSEDIVRIVVPSSVQIIRSGSFDEMEVLTEVILKNGTQIIEDTFNQCPKLFNVTIPSSVTSISDCAFNAENPYFHLTVEKGSYAEKYAEEHSIPYVYTKDSKKLDLEPGNIVSFGKHDEEWLVLKVEENEALLLSKDVLLTKCYSTNGHALWANSEINSYLNNMLLYDLFSMEEASLVTAHRIYDPASPYSLIGYPGNSTICHLFLLSYYEARDYLPSNEQRAATEGWWLRTSRDYINETHYVSANGDIMEGKQIIETLGVRPALWIRTDNAVGIVDIVDDNVWKENQEEDDGVFGVGSKIKLGSYEQDNDTSNGAEPISWIVLNVDGTEATLISEYCIDVQRYHDTETAVSWEESSLNMWLNRDFLNTAFTEEEQKYLIRTAIDNYSSYDKIWILDLDEVNRYLPNQEDKLSKVTKYAAARGAAKSTEGYGTWLLRTHKNSQKLANIILPYTGDMSVNVTRTDASIRPVIKVDLIKLGIICSILSPADGTILESGKDVLIEWNSVVDAEIYYIDIFKVSKDGEEFIWGTQIGANESNSTVVPAGMLVPSDYVIEVQVCKDDGDYNDCTIASDRIEISTTSGFTNPVNGNTVPVGQKLQLEWMTIPGVTCYSVQVYPASSTRILTWHADLEHGECTVEIPRSTLVESSYLIELRAWKDKTYGEEVFRQTITINTYNKFEENFDQTPGKEVDMKTVYTFDDYSYQLLEDGTIAFVGFNGYGDLIIPETIDGYTVTRIADGACYWNSALTAVSIPGTVKTIGSNAFAWCMSLEQINIAEGVTHIDDSAFSHNSGLKWINFANSITHIGEYVCSECPNVGYLELPEQLISIGEGAFSSCEGLWEITIPSNVKIIPNSAFFCCTSLEFVSFPKGLTEIGDFAFYGCEALNSVVIPDTVEIVGEWAFSYCTKLSSLSIADTTLIEDGAFSECSL